jgi:hypothetical protein
MGILIANAIKKAINKYPCDSALKFRAVKYRVSISAECVAPGVLK